MARLRLPLRRAASGEKMTVVQHLTELRTRVLVALAALVIAFIAMYAINERIIDLLSAPLPDDQGELITLSPTEPFFTIIKVSFYAALIVSMPVILYQVYAFVIPAVADTPRRVMLLVVAGVSSLFLAGVAFGYFVVLPVALGFLLDFGGEAFNTQLRAGEYYGFVSALLLGSGALFEVPIAMLALARLGVASAEIYRRQWRIAVVVIATIAAVLPGGDPLSMILLMLPQLLLYWVGIQLADRFGGPPLWMRESWAGGERSENSA